MWAAAYGLLALVAIVITWRDRDLQLVGLMLGASWALSNFSTIYLLPVERPAFYTVLEIGVAIMALFAWKTPRSRALLAVVCVCALSICANVALSWIGTPTSEQGRLWEVFTNICFGAECVLTIVARMRIYAGGGFDRRSLVRGDDPALDGARPGTGPR